MENSAKNCLSEQLVLRRHVYTMHILPVPADDIWAGKQSHRQLSDILLRMTGKVLGTEWLILLLTSFDYLQNLLNGFVSELNVFQIGQKKLIDRSEEHTSELQSLMRISYAVFCLKKKKKR